MTDEWVPINFPPNLMEMLEAWETSTEPNIGWCLMCNRPIRCMDDMIPETDTHDCPAGRALVEAHSRVAGKSRTKPPKPWGEEKGK